MHPQTRACKTLNSSLALACACVVSALRWSAKGKEDKAAALAHASRLCPFAVTLSEKHAANGQKLFTIIKSVLVHTCSTEDAARKERVAVHVPLALLLNTVCYELCSTTLCTMMDAYMLLHAVIPTHLLHYSTAGAHCPPVSHLSLVSPCGRRVQKNDIDLSWNCPAHRHKCIGVPN